MSAGKVVIVTGGTYGIGRAISLTLAGKGYRVVAFGQEEKQIGSAAQNGIEGTRNELAQRQLSADLIVADVSKAREVEQVIRFAVDKYKRIDALVNNAAIRPRGTILETDEELWDQVMAVNLKGMFLATRAALPHMIRQGGGAIVNIGSGSGWGRANRLAYCASKGGVFAFSAALARDHRKDNIRVNVVVPGLTSTGMTEAENSPSLVETRSGERKLLPQDSANTVAFLLSEEAEMISGSVITVGTAPERSN